MNNSLKLSILAIITLFLINCGSTTQQVRPQEPPAVKQSVKSQPSNPQPSSPKVTPPSQTVKQEISIEVVSVSSPVNKGASATLRAKTSPGATCNITVYYKSGPSQAAGLNQKIADEQGNVSWTWKVGSRTTSGNWRIEVSASKDGKQASATTSFDVS